jgi:deoxyribonuclease-4
VVVHGGYLTGDGPIADAYPRWRKALLELDTGVPVLIENTATGENAVARRLETIEQLWAEIGDLNPGFVLDTCHAWAGGEPCEDLSARIRAITGRIDLVHCNDSRDLFDSHRDRHANLGSGEIPEILLASMISDSRAPVVVETPGGVEEHLADLAWVRAHMADLSAT